MKAIFYANALVNAGATLVLIISLALPRVAQTESFSVFKVYKNTETGLSFEYPAEYAAKALLAPDGKLIDISLFKEDGRSRKWLMQISLLDSAEYPREIYGGDRPTVSFKEFAIAEALNHCAADGPDGGVSCDKTTRFNEFTTDNGLKGSEFYLNQIETFNDNDEETGTIKVTISERGPVYAFDISSGQSIRIFLVEPGFLSMQYSDETEMLETMKAIVKSFKMKTAAN